jgi:hypothetical protein
VPTAFAERRRLIGRLIEQVYLPDHLRIPPFDKGLPAVFGAGTGEVFIGKSFRSKNRRNSETVL